MKIALDGRNIFSPSRRGTGKNLLDLYRTLSELRPTWEITIFHQLDLCDDPALSELRNLPNINCVRIDIPGDRWDLWRRIRLPLAAARMGADLLHCPANLAAGPGPVSQIVTIHDLIALDERFNSDPDSRAGWHKNLQKAASRARAIITPSNFSKKQIEQKLRCPPEKVHVNHWAADSGCVGVRDAELLKSVRSKYNVSYEECPDGFVLALGGADLRKNTARMIRSWARLPNAIRAGRRLLIVGLQDVVLDEYRAMVSERGLDDSCLVSGFADEADMASLITAAEILFYPSLSEGFGLPLLDGFACGTPVLCSNVTSLPEVAGDAALMVNPENDAEIAAGLEKLLTCAELADELVRRGEKRVKLFSWQACASRVADIFERAAAR